MPVLGTQEISLRLKQIEQMSASCQTTAMRKKQEALRAN